MAGLAGTVRFAWAKGPGAVQGRGLRLGNGSAGKLYRLQLPRSN